MLAAPVETVEWEASCPCGTHPTLWRGALDGDGRTRSWLAGPCPQRPVP